MQQECTLLFTWLPSGLQYGLAAWSPVAYEHDPRVFRPAVRLEGDPGGAGWPRAPDFPLRSRTLGSGRTGIFLSLCAQGTSCTGQVDGVLGAPARKEPRGPGPASPVAFRRLGRPGGRPFPVRSPWPHLRRPRLSRGPPVEGRVLREVSAPHFPRSRGRKSKSGHWTDLS